MISFEGSLFSSITIDFQAYIRSANQKLITGMKEGAKRFYQASVVNVPQPGGPIKSDRATGFSSGAFSNILFALKHQRASGLDARDLVPKIMNNMTGKRREDRERQREILFYIKQLKKRLDEIKRNRKEPTHIFTQKRTRKVGGKTVIDEVLRFKRRTEKESRVEMYKPSKGAAGVPKNAVTGRKFATPIDDIIIREKGTERSISTTVRFKFHININYFNIEDLRRNRSPHSPWGAMQAGKVAMVAYLNSPEGQKKLTSSVFDFASVVQFRMNKKGFMKTSRKTTRLKDIKDGE